MKKIYIILILFISSISLFVSCASYRTINFKELNDFKNDIKNEFSYIKKLDVYFSQSSFNFRYTLNTNVDIEKIDTIAEETKEFFNDSTIKSNFKDIYKNTYDDQYPSVYIYFNGYDHMYQAMYQNGIDEIDDYETWIIHGSGATNIAK